MGLRGWPKTAAHEECTSTLESSSGGRSPKCRRAALAFSREIERRVPALATSKWWKEERHGVFLDYNQNAKDRTTCSAYSIRPLPDARVSAPLRWDEVPRLRSRGFHRADDARAIREARRSKLRNGRSGRLTRSAARPRRARRSRRTRRRPMAAAFSKNGRRSAACGSVARKDSDEVRQKDIHEEGACEAAFEDAAHYGRQLARQGRRTRWSRAVEGTASRSRVTPRCG